MRAAILLTGAFLITGCVTYIYAPKDIRVTSPDAKVTLNESTVDNMTENDTEALGAK